MIITPKRECYYSFVYPSPSTSVRTIPKSPNKIVGFMHACKITWKKNHVVFILSCVLLYKYRIMNAWEIKSGPLSLPLINWINDQYLLERMYEHKIYNLLSFGKWLLNLETDVENTNPIVLSPFTGRLKLDQVSYPMRRDDHPYILILGGLAIQKIYMGTLGYKVYPLTVKLGTTLHF